MSLQDELKTAYAESKDTSNMNPLIRPGWEALVQEAELRATQTVKEPIGSGHWIIHYFAALCLITENHEAFLMWMSLEPDLFAEIASMN